MCLAYYIQVGWLGIFCCVNILFCWGSFGWFVWSWFSVVFTACADCASSISVFSVTVHKDLEHLVGRLDTLMLLAKPWLMDQHLLRDDKWHLSVSDKATQGGQVDGCWPLVEQAPHLPQWILKAHAGTVAVLAAVQSSSCAQEYAREFPGSFELGGASEQVKNTKIFGWMQHGVMCQESYPLAGLSPGNADKLHKWREEQKYTKQVNFIVLWRRQSCPSPKLGVIHVNSW